ncbi:MAG: hypothetical protein ACLU4N_10465 [Butyricimonas faecihominis]
MEPTRQVKFNQVDKLQLNYLSLLNISELKKRNGRKFDRAGWPDDTIGLLRKKSGSLWGLPESLVVYTNKSFFLTFKPGLQNAERQAFDFLDAVPPSNRWGFS